jgi:hypothetical protein
MADTSERNLDLEYVGLFHFRRQAKDFFFHSMRCGYTTSPRKGMLSEMPGSKTIEVVHENFRTLDTYLVTPQDPFSGGTTCQWYGAIPVWMMQYMGYYDEDAIPCLKAALSFNYENDTFYGGRGPEFFVHEGYTYINRVTENDFFGRASCEEQIFNPEGRSSGWHCCQSIWMVKP